MREASPALRRLFALTLLAGALALAWFAIAAPAIDAYGAARATEERLEATLRHRARLEVELAALKDELTTLTQRQSSIVGFLEASNESIAAAELQSKVRSAVQKAKGELRSAQVLFPQDDDTFRRIILRGEAEMTLPALQRVLHELETATPYLFLDNLDIRLCAARGAGAGQAEPVLDFRFDVSGFMRRGA